ncbi:polyketide synthase dehydratase domain-containing protein [Lentzea sp. NPDC005914]|uniref:polyketide synthase dehydratase domain-containing protein n=1 Tax=Lentzea sp. NPDC005914 TaxID=3154572 RepID=UPI0033E3DE66
MRHIVLGASTHPFLRDHSIAGTPVVPMAMVLEWFAAAATAWPLCPNLLVLRGVTALRKIALPGFHAGGDQCEVRCEVVDETLSLMLVSSGGVPHHRASAARFPLPVQRRPWSVPRDLRPAVRSSPYDGRVLFQGPSFRSIRRVSGISPSGALGVVAGLRELSWPDGPWQLDPAAIDGGLQLATLWAEHAIGAATWPQAIRECQVHVPGPVNGTVRCLVLRRRASVLDAECDIAIINAAGELLVELAGVQLVARPEPRRSGQ